MVDRYDVNVSTYKWSYIFINLNNCIFCKLFWIVFGVRYFWYIAFLKNIWAKTLTKSDKLKHLVFFKIVLINIFLLQFQSSFRNIYYSRLEHIYWVYLHVQMHAYQWHIYLVDLLSLAPFKVHATQLDFYLLCGIITIE